MKHRVRGVSTETGGRLNRFRPTTKRLIPSVRPSVTFFFASACAARLLGAEAGGGSSVPLILQCGGSRALAQKTLKRNCTIICEILSLPAYLRNLTFRALSCRPPTNQNASALSDLRNITLFYKISFETLCIHKKNYIKLVLVQ